MSIIKKQPILFAWLTLVIVAAIFIINSTISLRPDNPQYIAIESTLRKYLQINTEARYSLDDSHLDEVLANDLRGSYNVGEGNVNIVKAVRWYTGKQLILKDHIGMLDFWHAYYAYSRQVKQLYDDAVADGIIDIASTTGQVSPESLPEVKALMQETGFQVARLPPPRPEVIVPEDFMIESVKVFLDEAYVVGDYSYVRVGLTFVRHSGQWYLVGSKILQSYGG